MHICIYACIHICIYAYLHTCIYAYANTYANAYAYTHVYTHMLIHVHTVEEACQTTKTTNIRRGITNTKHVQTKLKLEKRKQTQHMNSK